MTYQVIARKWRPQTFDEVTGQEHITRTLRNAVEYDRLHHAYIFSGARGVGKTSTARLFAKALNCHKSDKPTPAPCRTDDETGCHSCREIAEGRSIDVQEIDAASTTGVQNVRDSIIDTIGIAPARDRYKVFIIDEVHMLSTPAFNALLKTLEEPPPRVVFIMATTERHKLLDTIVSRCQQFEFRTIATAKIAERLRFISDSEKIKISDEALREIARAGEGSMRDAQSALDQIISFSGTEIEPADVEAALGIAGMEVLRRVLGAIAESNAGEVLAVVDNLVMRGHDLRNFCRDFMAYLRDLVVAKTSGQAIEVLELSDAERDALAEQAEAFTESDLIRFFHSLTNTESTLREAAHPRYHLEIGLIKLIEMRRLAPINQILERLKALEKSIGGGNPLAPTPTPTDLSGGHGREPGGPKQPPLITTNEVESKKETGAAIKAVVPESNEPEIIASAGLDSIVERIKNSLEKRRRMFLITALDEASSVKLENQELFIEFSPKSKHLRDNLATPDNVKILREVCRELVGYEIGLRIIIGESDGDTAAGPISKEDQERLDKKRMRETAEKDPAVQQVLKTFHGEIVDVKRVEKTRSSTTQKQD